MKLAGFNTSQIFIELSNEFEEHNFISFMKQSLTTRTDYISYLACKVSSRPLKIALLFFFQFHNVNECFSPGFKWNGFRACIVLVLSTISVCSIKHHQFNENVFGSLLYGGLLYPMLFVLPFQQTSLDVLSLCHIIMIIISPIVLMFSLEAVSLLFMASIIISSSLYILVVGRTYCMIQFNALLPMLFLYIAFNVLLLYQKQRRLLTEFFLLRKLEQISREQLELKTQLASVPIVPRENNDDDHTKQAFILTSKRVELGSDMQAASQLVNNMAHDLKSPIAAAIIGLDNLESINFGSRIANTSLTRSMTNGRENCGSICSSVFEDDDNSDGDYGYNFGNDEDCLVGIDPAEKLRFKQDVRNLKSIMNFMLMSVNRCMDYAKLSNGLKIVPKLESFDLSEALQLPINCVQCLQTRIKIELVPLPIDISKDIVSDEQWFQENLMCYLSNAAKYSISGTITIRISTQDIDSVKSGNIEPILENVPENDDTLIVDSDKVKRHISTDNLIKLSTLANISSSASVSSHSSVVTGSSRGSHLRPMQQMPQQQQSFSTKSLLFNASRGSNKSIQSNKSYITTSNKQIITPLDMAAITTMDSSSTTTDSSSTSHMAVRPIQGFVSLTPRVNEKEMTESESSKVVRDKASAEKFLVVAVSDRGIGLTEEGMGGLFSELKQAQQMAGGTGLGLFSLSRRVEAQGGYYGVKKRNDGKHGSVFWFAIPYKADTEACIGGSEVSTSSFDMELLNFEMIPLKILIVDDSIAILKMVGSMMRKKGHQVDECLNGFDALEKVADNIVKSRLDPDYRYDLVFMDLQMPVMDGLECTRRARRIEEQLTMVDYDNYAKLKIVGCSGNKSSDVLRDVFAAGMDAFVEKPMSLKHFTDIYKSLFSS